MTTTFDIAKALELERNRQGLTVTEVISRAGVSRAAVYRLLNGDDVQLTTLLAVSTTLGLDLIPMRANLARLMPETTPTHSSPAQAMTQPVRRQQASSGPPSAVAARAARVQAKLARSRP